MLYPNLGLPGDPRIKSRKTDRRLGLPGVSKLKLLPNDCLLGKPFSLLDLNPDAYLDISNPDGVTVDGSNNLTNIADLSGNGVDYYQNTLVQTWDYVYDSDVRKYVGQGGTKGGLDNSYYVTSADYITTTSDTWFFVFKDNPAGKSDANLIGQYGNVGGQLMVVRADNDSAVDIFYVRDENNDTLQVTTPFISGWDVLVCVREPGKITMHYNQSVFEQTGTYLASTYLANGPTDFYNPTLGVQPNGAGGVINNSHFSGRFGLMAKFNSAMPLDTINLIKGNLAAEWNISNY